MVHGEIFAVRLSVEILSISIMNLISPFEESAVCFAVAQASRGLRKRPPRTAANDLTAHAGTPWRGHRFSAYVVRAIHVPTE